MTEALARLEGIERRFGSVVALDGADLELRAGEVHGVLGANGAGKSTLFNVLGGLLTPDAGTIEVAGRPVSLSSPRDAWALGIGLVHQHFTLVPTLSVVENLALGTRGSLDGESVLPTAERIMERTGLRVPLRPPVETLGVGDRQRIEILKALLRNPRVLVLDEPTAVLTPDEIEGLFGLLRDLADEGRAVSLVAHKLDEVLSVADRVTVLRAGRTVLTATRDEREVRDFVRAMVGDEVADPIALGIGSATGGRRTGVEGDVVVRLRGVGAEGRGGAPLCEVDLEIEAGEVVGIAGVEGNGQRELALVLAGRLAPSEGAADLPDEIGFIPQDRTDAGMIADFDLSENVALAFHRRPEFRWGPWLLWGRLEEEAESVRARYDVAAASVSTLGRALSGGNQQRMIVGRELAMASELLVAENPTRGLDIAASAFVHDELRRLASEGVAIALISTDLDEILALSDRIFAIARGRLREVPRSARSREGVGALMLAGSASDG